MVQVISCQLTIRHSCGLDALDCWKLVRTPSNGVLVYRGSGCHSAGKGPVHLLLSCQAPDVIVSALGLVGPVSVFLWPGEIESLIFSFSLSVAARKIEQICPCDTLACCLDFRQPATSNKDVPLDGYVSHCPWTVQWSMNVKRDIPTYLPTYLPTWVYQHTYQPVQGERWLLQSCRSWPCVCFSACFYRGVLL